MRLNALIVLASASLPAGAAEQPDQAKALTELVRPLVLASLPDPLVKSERDWGRQVVAPVGVKWRGVRPTVQKAVRNGGHWQRLTAVPIDPEQTFELAISDLSTPTPGKTAFTVRMALAVRGEHELQEWVGGVRVVSTTTRARCRVAVRLDCVCTSRVGVAPGDLLPSAELALAVERAECSYSGFVCERVAGVGGKPAALAGEATRAFIRRVKPSLEGEILTKANVAVMRAIESRPVRVELDKLLLGQIVAAK